MSGNVEAQSAAKVRPGALYVLGTPIGNLEDITLRALRILREVDLIACEDTRQTRKLLNHFQIEKPATSYQEHNEAAKVPELLRRMEDGANIALVSDAGMPAVSDPGYRLVNACISRNIRVVPIPGPSALLTALVASGLPTDAFQFVGFAPPKKSQRRKFLQHLGGCTATTVFFEAPHRIMEMLADVIEVLGDRRAVVARELTKVHEEFLRGSCSQVLQALAERPKIQGEMTVLIGAPQAENAEKLPNQPLKERVRELIDQNNLSQMEALKAVARERHISKSQAYREFQA